MAAVSIKLAPRTELDRFVSYLRVTQPEPATPLVPYLRLPDGQLELIVRFTAQGGSVKVIGTRTHALQQPTASALDFVTVRFKAGGAYPFFGLPISELTDQLVPLELLWGAVSEELEDALYASESHAARVALVERALARRLTSRPFEPASLPSVRRAIRLLRTAHRLPTVDALARDVGASTRQLRRAFSEVVGVGPKQFLRVERFQRALRAARRAPTASFGALAGSNGYADQAHLSAEFRALAGVTPSELCPRSQRVQGAAGRPRLRRARS